MFALEVVGINAVTFIASAVDVSKGVKCGVELVLVDVEL